MNEARPVTGLSAIALAVLFNIPYATLASIFEYPDILRRPAGEVLSLFAAGGPMLVLTWYAFMLSALAFIPVAFALSLSPSRMASMPALSIGASTCGALAGIVQAIGLSRWVFVVPGLARDHARGEDAIRFAAERTFDMLNQFGGVAIGEHLGQLLTSLFVGLLSSIQWAEGRYITATIGIITAAAITAGTGEGLALAIGQSGDMFSLATIAGFLGLTAWLIATGIGLLSSSRK